MLTFPHEWELTPLASLLSEPLSYGINAPAVPYNRSLPTYIRITDINEDGTYNNTDKASVISSEAYKYQLKNGDIVLARTGASTGKSYLYKEKDGELVFAGFLIKASIDFKKHNPYYIFSQLHMRRYWDWVAMVSMRSGQPGINSKEYGSFLLPIADKSEQDRIAETLAVFDTHIANLTELIEKKKDIRIGALEALLSRKERINGFTGSWVEVPLISVLREKIKIGPFGSQLKKETLIKSGAYKVYGQENIYQKDFSIGDRYLSQAHFDMLSSCEIKSGDFLMSTMGTIGKCAIAPSNIQKGIMDSHLIRFRIDKTKILPEYLLHLFSDNYTYLSNQTSKLAVGGIMDGLSVGIANQLMVFMPEDLREQSAITETLSAIDEEIKALENERDKMIKIREGAMDDLLTGKVRLTD